MAPDEAKKRLDRATKLLEAALDLHEKQGAVLDELKKIVLGEQAMGDVLKHLEGTYNEEWKAAYGSPYAFAFMKDRPQWKRLLKFAHVEDITRRIRAYLRDRDPYLVRARHPFGLFVSRFNTLAGDPASAPTDLTLDAPTIADCKHTPRCLTDQEHTRRKTAEMRTWGQ